jgi:hypothetical protein
MITSQHTRHRWRMRSDSSAGRDLAVVEMIMIQFDEIVWYVKETVLTN